MVAVIYPLAGFITLRIILLFMVLHSFSIIEQLTLAIKISIV